jgi:hypothetical protein
MVLNPRVLSQAMTQGLSGSPQKTHLEWTPSPPKKGHIYGHIQ